jgi:hypothetical protein
VHNECWNDIECLWHWNQSCGTALAFCFSPTKVKERMCWNKETKQQKKYQVHWGFNESSREPRQSSWKKKKMSERKEKKRTFFLHWGPIFMRSE